MSEYIVQGESLTLIADAIRAKTGATDTITLAQMPELINGIQTGGGGGFPNGTEWTKSNVTSGSYNALLCVNGMWVTAQTLGGVYYSYDGMTWNKASLDYGSSSSYNDSLALRYADGVWVMSFKASGLYYSTDGITWTQSNITSGYAYDIKNANGIWVTVTNGFWYSLDGKTWVQSNITEGSGPEGNSICNANGVWVASTTSGGAYYSTDGMTWTQSNITSRAAECINYNNGIWTAINNGYICYSVDGMTWTVDNGTYSSYSATDVAICYGKGIWVTLNRGSLFYSTNGMDWTKYGTSYYYKGLYYANGIWVVGEKYNGLSYSLDGETWTKSNVTTGDGFTHILNADGVWVVDLYNGKGVYYSTDGKTWTQTNCPNNNIYSIFHANGVWAMGLESKGLFYSLTWAPPA